MIDFYIPKFDIGDEPDYSGFIRTPDMAYIQPRPVYDNYINSVPSSDLYTNEDNVTGHVIDQELDRHIKQNTSRSCKFHIENSQTYCQK